MLYQQVAVKLRVLEQGVERIRRDAHLSDMGKERALKNLQAETEQFRSEARQALAQAWKDTREWYQEAEAQYARAENEESERWNYPKLSHERQALESRLKSVSSVEELEKLYSQVETSGVPERKRALFELTPEYARSFRSGSLAKKAERSLSELTNTPEMLKAQERGSKLVERAKELKQVTEQAGNFYWKDSIFRGGVNEFTELMAGVKLSEHYESESGRFRISLEIGEPEPLTSGVVWSSHTHGVAGAGESGGSESGGGGSEVAEHCYTVNNSERWQKMAGIPKKNAGALSSAFR